MLLSRSATSRTAAPESASPSVHALAVIRILFGVVLGIDAFFKWLPAFSKGFVSYVSNSEPGQPQAVKDWLAWWVSALGADPRLFATLVAICETCLAIGLIFGLFSRAVCFAGILLALGIWSTAEGFGGPYTSGVTDIGTSIIYALVYPALLFGHAADAWSLDPVVRRYLGPLRFLCASPVRQRPAQQPPLPAPSVIPGSRHAHESETVDTRTDSHQI